MDGLYQIKLGNVLIRYYDKIYRIKKHVYYRALINNDGELYEKQINKSKHQRKKKSASWKGFLRLKDSIETHGYRPGKSSIIIKFYIDGNLKYVPCVIHGRHRIVLLMYIYGPNLTLIVEVKNGTGKIIQILD